MRKRSSLAEIRYHEIELPTDFPISGGLPSSQKDLPITFLHFHQCLEIGYCHSGNGVFMIGDKILPFQQGDVSFINHREVHLARSAPGSTSEWSWVYLDPIRLIQPAIPKLKSVDPSPLCGTDFGNILSAKRYPKINRVVLDLIDELRSRKRNRDDSLRALAWQLMLITRRLAPKEELSGVLKVSQYHRVAAALQHIAHHYTAPVEVGHLAKLCHLSEPHFRRIFSKVVGQGPREYWISMRLRMAVSLLENSSFSILEISQEVGFGTLSSFNRLFLMRFGMSPRQWKIGAKSK